MVTGLPSGAEKRRDPRYEINAPGMITVIGRRLNSTTLPCSVVNISESGALLEIEPSLVLSDEFYLEVVGATVLRKHCVIVRREVNRIGVRFL